MKQTLLALLLCLTQFSQAQPSFTAAKTKNHSISFYLGASDFENYNRNSRTYTYKSLNPDGPPSFSAISNFFSLTYKYKKHEIIPVLYLRNYETDKGKVKPFLLGGSLSYLYHFSQKRTHFFFEANFQTYFYTTQDGYINITPYGSSQHQKDWIDVGFHAAGIQTYVVNPALGLEVKLFKLTYLQLACGSGAFYMKGKSALPANINAQWAQWGLPDDFKNTYSGIFGVNWYARISIIVRAFNF